MRRAALEARRIVVKIGSSILTRDGELQSRVFGDVSRQVSELLDAGREVVIVSSGAIAIGARELGWSHGDRPVPEKQAAAAVGQIGLIEQYRRRFARRGRRVAQILVTRSGLEDRERFINARHTLLELLRIGVVPIVNENDTVATDEIRFGDNDNLSATVANLIGADLLVILTDVEGLYREPPRAGATPTLFDVVERVTPEIETAAGGSTSAFGRGGMTTKLEAAQAAARCGATTVLCNGRRRDVLLRVAAGEAVGTMVLPHHRLASRKHGLAFTTRTHGELVLDDGAVRAIASRGKSLLPAGIVEVRGKFRVGDPVACVDARGRAIARGLTAYASDAVQRIAGRATREISQVLGYSNGDEVIHRDDLVLLGADSE
ncbi:MAG TPA: glutamate 5-kinase [Myxococcota bacterium]|nr:glutamate 5-kinase [Myxococcota bacterium]